jgi:colicin import membrane protein
MNGASIFMLIVLAAALLVGMGFMVGELNRNANEILADRQTIQDLQSGLDQARAAAAQQQQAVDQLNASLAQQAAELAQARQALQAAQSDADGMRQALLDEQTARAAAEQQAAALSGQVQILQNRTADLEAQMDSLYQEKTRLEQQISQPSAARPQIPLTGAAQSSSPAFPCALPFAGLALAGGGAAWFKSKAG